MSNNLQRCTSTPKGTPMTLPEGVTPKGTPMTLPEGIPRGKPRIPGPWKGYFINPDDNTEVAVIIRYNLCHTRSGKLDKRKKTITLREVFFLSEHSTHPVPDVPTMDVGYMIPAVFALNVVEYIKHGGWKMLLDKLLPN